MRFRDRLRYATKEAGAAWSEQTAWDKLSTAEKIVAAARTAYERGDVLYQVDLQVGRDTHRVLNAVAAEGWELHSTGVTADPLATERWVQQADTAHYVFKRRA